MQSAHMVSILLSRPALRAAMRLPAGEASRLALVISLAACALACSEDTAGSNGASAAKTYGLPTGVLNTLKEDDLQDILAYITTLQEQP